MAADPLRCPACSGAISSPGRARCEWCGAALPVAPKAPDPVAPRDSDRDRLAAVLEQMQARGAVQPRSHGPGCLFFVLLLLALAFVLFFTLTPGRIVPSATESPPAPQSPSPASRDAERAEPPRGQ